MKRSISILGFLTLASCSTETTIERTAGNSSQNADVKDESESPDEPKDVSGAYLAFECKQADQELSDLWLEGKPQSESKQVYGCRIFNKDTQKKYEEDFRASQLDASFESKQKVKIPIDEKNRDPNITGQWHFVFDVPSDYGALTGVELKTDLDEKSVVFTSNPNNSKGANEKNGGVKKGPIDNIADGPVILKKTKALIFITSTKFKINDFRTREQADALCMAAGNSFIPKTFTALLHYDAEKLTDFDPVPERSIKSILNNYHDQNVDLISTDGSRFMKASDIPMRKDSKPFLDESGNYSGSMVWTGSSIKNCDNWQNDDGHFYGGSSSGSEDSWINTTPVDCNGNFPIYCLENL